MFLLAMTEITNNSIQGSASIGIRDIITIAIFVLLWAGQLIWNISKQGQINRSVAETLKKNAEILDDHEKDMESMRKWGEDTVKERAEYNERHYVLRERFDDTMKGVNASIMELKAVNIEGRLCRIEQAIIPFTTFIEGIMSGKIVIQEIKNDRK